MEAAFEDAMVTDFDNFLPVAAARSQRSPRFAAAAKAQAAMIVTENLRDSGGSSFRPEHGGEIGRRFHCRYYRTRRSSRCCSHSAYARTLQETGNDAGAVDSKLGGERMALTFTERLPGLCQISTLPARRWG